MSPDISFSSVACSLSNMPTSTSPATDKYHYNKTMVINQYEASKPHHLRKSIARKGHLESTQLGWIDKLDRNTNTSIPHPKCTNKVLQHHGACDDVPDTTCFTKVCLDVASKFTSSSHDGPMNCSNVHASQYDDVPESHDTGTP